MRRIELAGEGAPNARRCQRHLNQVGTAALTGVIERFDHRIDDGRGRDNRAQLANAFHAEQVRRAIDVTNSASNIELAMSARGSAEF